MNATTLRVGQTLLLARHRAGKWSFNTVTIEKIGRKYVHCNYGVRFLIATMREDGYNGGSVYPDRAAFDAEQARLDRWTAFRRAIVNVTRPGKHITTHMIERAAAALGIEI